MRYSIKNKLKIYRQALKKLHSFVFVFQNKLTFSLALQHAQRFNQNGIIQSVKLFSLRIIPLREFVKGKHGIRESLGNDVALDERAPFLKRMPVHLPPIFLFIQRRPVSGPLQVAQNRSYERGIQFSIDRGIVKHGQGTCFSYVDYAFFRCFAVFK